MRLKNHDIRLDNLHYWPANIKRTVLILINVLVILLGLLLESSVLSSITSSHQRNNELKKELLIKKNFSTQAQDDLKQLNILQQQQNNLNLTLPEKSDVTLFIQSLSNIAEQNNSAFKTLEPLPESVENFYHIVPVHGVMLGSYQQLGNFINDLLMEKRLINIGDFTFQATKDNGILSFDFVANSYYYDANANNPHESSPAHPIFQREEAFKFTRDPFLPMGNEIASDKCLLCDASIHALKMVGTMTIDGKLWALIQSPSSISLVKVGDKIGEEQIPIINITDHSVLLNNHFTLEMNHS